jgi:hypothetical protein
MHQNGSRIVVTAQLDRRNYPTGTEPTPEQLQSLRLKAHRGSAEVELPDLRRSRKWLLRDQADEALIDLHCAPIRTRPDVFVAKNTQPWK